MSFSARVPTLRHTLRHILRQPYSTARASQRPWAQVQDIRFRDVRFLATQAAQERVLEKYKEKLESKAKQEGLKDITELKSVYKEKIETLRKEATVPGATGPLNPTPSSSTAPFNPPPPPSPTPSTVSSTSTTSSASSTTSKSSPASTSAPPPGVKVLNSFLDIEKITPLPSTEIQALWRLRHASNPQSIHFALPASTFRNLQQTAKAHPTFVLPLPRQIPVDHQPTTTEQAEPETRNAAELHYLQFSTPHNHTTTLIFTSLLEFQTHGEFATPHTTITFHSELSASHDLVLGQGIVTPNRGVTPDEARWLIMCMQKFYVIGEPGETESEERRRLLEMFTRGDGEGFKVEKLLQEAEKIL